MRVYLTEEKVIRFDDFGFEIRLKTPSAFKYLLSVEVLENITIMNNKIDQQKKCEAKSKRTGNRCQGLAMKNGKCRVHGGKTPSGLESPNFKTGKHSKVLKFLNLAADYEQVLDNEKLHRCRDEIALVDALLLERLGKLTHGETRDAWEYLQNTFKYLLDVKTYLESEQFKTDKKKKHTQADFEQAFQSLGEIIAHGLVRYEAFEIVQPMLEQRRRLCETEGKLIKDEQLAYPVEKVMLIMVAIGTVVKKYVVEPAQRQQCAKELADVIGRVD